MGASKAAAAWQSLNDRQRLYLSAIFDADQAAERDIGARSVRWEKAPPASEWRLVLYDLKLPKGKQTGLGYSTIQQAVRRQGAHDPGAGFTLVVVQHHGPGHWRGWCRGSGCG